MNSDFGSKTVMTKIMENETKLEELKSEKLILSAQKKDANPEDLVPHSEFKKILESLNRDIYKLDPPKRRRLLKSLISRVEIRYPDKMAIKINYDKGSIALVREYLRNLQTPKTKKAGANAPAFPKNFVNPKTCTASSFQLQNGGDCTIAEIRINFQQLTKYVPVKRQNQVTSCDVPLGSTHFSSS